MQYHRARYYDASLGIWTAEDFLETPNRYGYVSGNPTNLVDMNGLNGSHADLLDTGVAANGLPINITSTSSAYAEAGFAFGLGLGLGSIFDEGISSIQNTATQFGEDMVRAQASFVGALAVLPSVTQASINNLTQTILPSTGTIAVNPPVAQPPSFDPERLWRDVQDICTAGLASLLAALTGVTPIVRDIPSTRNLNPNTIIELGAGDYKNAIAMKAMFPNARVIATNSFLDWDAGRNFVEVATSLGDQQIPQSIIDSMPNLQIYMGWIIAKKLGVEVGLTRPITNEQVQPNHIGDIVFSIYLILLLLNHLVKVLHG